MSVSTMRKMNCTTDLALRCIPQLPIKAVVRQTVSHGRLPDAVDPEAAGGVEGEFKDRIVVEILCEILCLFEEIVRSKCA